MMNLRKIFPTTTLLLALLLTFASCDKDDVTIGHEDQNIEQPNTPNANDNNRGFLGLVSTETETETDSSYTDCFTINFPLDIIFPDGTTQTVDTEEQLMGIIELWFEDNQDTEEFPTIAFPITVTLADGTTETVNNDEEICDLYHECYGDFDDDEWEDEYMSECFTPVFPLNVTTADGTVTLANEEELEALLEGLDEDDLFELAFPLTVTLEEDGSTQTINNEDELEDLLIECYGDFEDDEWEDEYMGECFMPVFPLSVTTVDGTITVANEEELNTLLENLDEDDFFELAFPLTVTLEEDGSTLIITNEEELDELLIECYGDIDGEWEDCDDIGDFEDCFTIIFPFNVDSEGTITTINDEDGLIEFFESLDDDDDFELVYPVDLLLTDGTTVSVNSDEEIETILDNCD